jgi:hypothetical protein
MTINPTIHQLTAAECLQKKDWDSPVLKAPRDGDVLLIERRRE